MARWDPLRKLDRNKAVLQWAKRHPDLSDREIGERFGISKNRVWQLRHPDWRKKKVED